MTRQRPPAQRFLFTLLTLLLVCPHRAAAFGLNRQPTRWKQGASIEFVVNMANVPSTISQAQFVDVVRHALEPWTQIPTAKLHFTVGPVINDPDKTTPQADGVNVIFWESGSVPRGDMFAGKAYPFPSECDILLQPQAPYTLIDVRAIVIHELGHCMGLAHSTAHSVMTKLQGLPSLGSDDAIAVSLLYPSPEASLEEVTATITGQVKRSGRPLLGAVLRVIDPRTQRIVVAGFSGLVDEQRRKDSSGGFELPGLPPGRYTIKVEPMDAFTAADPKGYGAPVDEPPPPFAPLSVELPELEAGETHDVGSLDVHDR